MEDPRIEKLARVLVEYSTGVKPGDLVRINGALIARPLVTALYRAVLAAGAHPHISMAPDECAELKLAFASEEQLRWEDPLAQHAIETIDVSIGIWGDENTKALSGTAPARQALVSQARKSYLKTFMDRFAKGELRWVGTQFPTQAAAQDAEMSLRAYEDFVFRAGLLDHDDPAAAWRKVSEGQQRVADHLNKCREVRFRTPNGTDLTVGVEGRHWINCDGKQNFPDGEVFTGPRENETRGVVCFSFPAVHGGREAQGIRFEFRDGRVVNASATKGEEFLIALLDQDEGARVLGEIAIGTNYGIDRYTKNTLFDEKIGGTFHAAVGAAYPESGGTNQSGLHWDMVCDLRTGGTIEADGKVISRDGRFLAADWPQPN